MQLLEGKKVAGAVEQEIKATVNQLLENGHRPPALTAVLVGEDGASQTYVNAKAKACVRVGFSSNVLRLPAAITQEALIAKVQELNEDPAVDGFIVQLPLPKHLDESEITHTIDPKKDIDGFHPQNLGKMLLNLPGFLPATPYGILLLLEHYNINTKGMHCAIVGRSHIVGTPMSVLMGRKSQPGNCTVTLCHSATKDVAEVTRNADIIVAALGQPEFLKADMVKEGAIVVDVGITRISDATKKSGYRLVGDVDFETVAPKCSYITPVPGGVGPMTITALLKNTLLAVGKTRE